jgi:tetratricopeptide (TPR) repeat protein
MRDIPYVRAKRVAGGILLAVLLVGLLFSFRQSDPLAGFDPSSIHDEREAKITSLLELLKLEPEDFKTHGELAHLYFELQDYAKSAQHALQAIELGKKHGASKSFLTEQYLLLSKIYQAQGDTARAMEYASKAQENEPEKTAPLKRRGKVFEALRRNDKARLEYLKALKLDEKDPETYALLADQEFKRKKKKAAMEWLKMGVRRNPSSATAFRNLARGYARTGKNQKAREAYERALELDPNNAALRHEYAKHLKKMGDAAGYEKQLRQALASDPKNSAVLAAVGDIERAAGNKTRALELYREALKRDGMNQSLRDKYTSLYNEMRAAANGSATSSGAISPAVSSSTSFNGDSATKSADGSSGTESGTSGKTEGAADPSGAKAAAGTQDNTLDSGKKSGGESGNISQDLEAGKKAFAAKDFASAEAHFRSAVKKAPENTEARFFLARSLEAGGNKEAAMEEYRKLLEKDPDHARGNYYMGRLNYQAQKYAEAERLFARSVKADGKFAPAAYSLGLAQEKQGKSQQALSAYQKASAADSKLTQAHFNSAIIHKKNKKYDEALRELSQSGSGSDVEYQRGEILLKQKKFSEARETFGRVLKQKPQHYEAAFNLALVYHKLGDPAGADQVLAKVIRKDSPADLNYTYGKLLEESGELAGAKKQYSASVQKDPRYFKGWLNLGRVSAQSRDYVQAEQAYRQALTLDANSYEANLNLANTLYKQKKYEAAIEFFEAARRKDHKRDVVLPLAASYEGTGQNEKAARVYSEFLKISSKDRTTLERLGYLYYRKIKDKERALDQFNKLLKYYPTSEKTQEYKAMVSLIQKQKAEQ